MGCFVFAVATDDSETSTVPTEFFKDYPELVQKCTNIMLQPKASDDQKENACLWHLFLDGQYAGKMVLKLTNDSYITLDLIEIESQYQGQGIPWKLLSMAVFCHRQVKVRCIPNYLDKHVRHDYTGIQLLAVKFENENPPHPLYVRKGFQPLLQLSKDGKLTAKFGTIDTEHILEWLKRFDFRSRSFQGPPPKWETPQMADLRTRQNEMWPGLDMICFTNPDIAAMCCPANSHPSLDTDDANATPPEWLIRKLEEITQVDAGTREPYRFVEYPRGKPESAAASPAGGLDSDSPMGLD